MTELAMVVQRALTLEGAKAMSTTRRIGIALLALVTVAACKEEPLTPSSSVDLEGPAYPIQANVQGSPGDRAAMQQIVTTFDQAWNAGDAVTYAGQYADITDWVGPTGSVITDPGALVGLYTFILTVALPGTDRQSTIRNLTFLTGTVAVLDIDARVIGGSLPPEGIQALEKNVLVKRAGEWRIVQHQQTFVTPN
jgi:uncharacterized protein (TIGR02246 family)